MLLPFVSLFLINVFAVCRRILSSNVKHQNCYDIWMHLRFLHALVTHETITKHQQNREWERETETNAHQKRNCVYKHKIIMKWNENNETDFGLLTVYGYKSLLMLRNSYFDLNENELRLFGRRLLYSARHTKMPMTMIEIIMSQVQSFHIRNSSQRSSHTHTHKS